MFQSDCSHVFGHIHEAFVRNYFHTLLIFFFQKEGRRIDRFPAFDNDKYPLFIIRLMSLDMLS